MPAERALRKHAKELAPAAALAACAAAASLVPRAAALIGLVAAAIVGLVWLAGAPRRWIGAFFFCALLLPPLPLPVGNSGPHPALAAAGTGLFAGMLRMRRWEVKPDLLNFALFAFTAVLAASLAPAALYSGVGVAAGSFARVCLFVITVYLFFYVRGVRDRAAGEQAFRLLFAAAVAAATVACVDFYYQLPAPAGFGPQFIWLDSGVYRRAQGLFYEASTLGNFCAFFLVMIAASLIHPAGNRLAPRRFLIAGSIPLAAALVLSYSRASLIALFCASATLLWLNRARLRFGRVAAGLAGGIAVTGLALAAFFPVFARMYLLRLGASAQYFLAAPELVLSGRLSSWRTLLGFLADNPWHMLAGIGYKTLPYSNFAGQPVVADNMYLSLLVETGIPGLAALLLLCFAMLRASLRAARGPDASRSFLGTWFFCFWVGEMVQMMSGDLLTYWRVLPVYFYVLASAVRE